MSSEASPFYRDGQLTTSAWHLWNIAADAAARAKEERDDILGATTPSSVSAIVLAAVSVECFMNELGEVLELRPFSGKTGIGPVLIQLENDHASVAAKFRVAGLLLPGDPYRSDTEPFQGLEMLTRLRNDFVHPKAQGRPPRYFHQFVQRGWTHNRPEEKQKLWGWMLQLQTPEVAAWACRTAAAIASDVYARLTRSSFERASPWIPHLLGKWEGAGKDERVQDTQAGQEKTID